MDHREIDERDLAAGYLRHTLTPEDCAAFEAHLVDCQECADRLLLAEMFHARNGGSHAALEPASQPAEPAQARLEIRLPGWQAALLLATGGLLLVAMAAAGVYLLG